MQMSDTGGDYLLGSRGNPSFITVSTPFILGVDGVTSWTASKNSEKNLKKCPQTSQFNILVN